MRAVAQGKDQAAAHQRQHGGTDKRPLPGEPQGGAAQQVGQGDVLTFAQGRQVRVVRIAQLGTRRGPAPEAQALYEDITPAAPADAHPPNPRYEGKGRPTKRDRRKLFPEGSGSLE